MGALHGSKFLVVLKCTLEALHNMTYNSKLLSKLFYFK